MKRISLSDVSHEIVRSRLLSGGVAIDATLGNGHDTLFLAQCVGEAGHVFGFDIQEQAIQASRQRLLQQDLLTSVTLQCANHADMIAHIPRVFHGQIRAIMFNLGYLPGADKRVITQTETSLKAIEAGCQLLAVQGIMTVMAYPGHAGGDTETECLQQWLNQLESTQFSTEVIFSQHHRESAPRLFVIGKLR